MKLELLVIRSKDIYLLARFYEQLGLEYHQHGKGPMHYRAINYPINIASKQP